MAAVDEHERAADLLEKLLTDAKFRAAFRRNPAAAAKKFGLTELAAEFSSAGKAMYTLEIRESRSSLAGVMMAAAAEGVDVADLQTQASGQTFEGPAQRAVEATLSRASIQAIPDPSAAGNGAGNGAAVAAPGVETPSAPPAAPPADPPGGGTPGAAGESVPGVETPGTPGVEVPAPTDAPAGASAPAGVVAAVPVAGSAPGDAAAVLPDDGGGSGRVTASFAAIADQAAEQQEQAATAGRDTFSFAAVEAPQEQGASAAAAPVVDQLAPAAPPAPPAFAAPIDVSGLANTNEGGALHGSEFGAADAEGAPDASGVRRHAAYDLFGDAGAEVRAPMAGTVVEVKASVGSSGQIFGGVVKVQGADGKVWVFRHVDPSGVSVGQSVAAGAPIAAVSAWDGGTPHAHIEIWKSLEGGYRYENMEDPLPYLQQAYEPQAAQQVVPGAGAAAEVAAPGAPGGLPQTGPGFTDAFIPGDEAAEVAAVVNSPNLDLPAGAVEDLVSGEMDPRLVHLLYKMSQSGHEVGLSVIRDGHRQFTSGGSVSNHFVGRGLDVATVDGQPVGPGNLAAKDLAEQLADLPPELRPTEIGTPWAINDDGYFTDAAHCNHLHIAWDGECPHSMQYKQEAAGRIDPSAAPAPSAAPSAAAVPGAAVAGAVPGTAGAPGVVPAPEGAEEGSGRESGAFAAIAESDAAKKQVEADPGRATFTFAAVQEQQPAPVAQPAGVQPVVDPAAVVPGAASGAIEFLPDGSDTYPGDDAPKEDIAAWMGRQAHKAGLPAELPVMAGLVESGLENVDHGDADSLGYFQMRTSIWNQGEYAGYAEDPQKQMKWFIDRALEVKGQRLADGRGAELQDPQKFGEWVADIELPAEQYRGRYHERLGEAQELLEQSRPVTTPAQAALVSPGPPVSAAPAQIVAPGSGAAVAIAPQTANGVLADAVTATTPVDAGNGLAAMKIDGITATGSPKALEALRTVFSYKGTPYKWGGEDPSTGFDCSGITQWAYKEAGFDISRVTYTQVNDGVAVEPNVDSMQAGDLIFFQDASGDNHHMGMYIGEGKFIHAPSTGDVVKVSSLDEPYYKQQFFAARRIAPPDPAASASLAPPAAPVTATPAAAAAAQPALPPDAAAAADEAGRRSAVFAAVEAEGKKKVAADTHVRATVQFIPAISDQAQAPAQPVAPVTPVQQPAQVVQAVQPSGAAAEAVAGAVGPTPGGYPGDDAPKEAIASWMAERARARGIPPELPVMAALVESGLKNVNYGDADSLGYFQMRTSIWDQGEYLGFSRDPEKQIDWFLDQAVAEKERRFGHGFTSFVDDPNKWGEWIADVERPAEQYRGRYQLRLSEARQLLGS